MALVTRYFSTTAAGTGDGTSWENRAALFVGGNWSSVITTFVWGTNRLECRIGPGNYTCSQQLSSAILHASSTGFSLILYGCNSDGTLWTSPKWSSAQSVFWENEIPCIDYTLDGTVITFSTFLRGIKIKRGNNTHGSGSIISNCTCDWVIAEFHPNISTTGIIVSPSTGSVYTNTVIKSYSLGYARAFQLSGAGAINFAINCRVENIITPVNGTRIAFETNRILSGTATSNIVNCTVVNGIIGFSCGLSARMVVTNNTIITSSVGVESTITTPASYISLLQCNQNFIVSPTGVKEGIGGTRFSLVVENRIRAATPLNINTDQPSWNNYTDSGSDTDEFVDAANGDYRIKRTSIYWGKNIGAGDEPASADNGYYNPFRQPVRIG